MLRQHPETGFGLAYVEGAGSTGACNHLLSLRVVHWCQKHLPNLWHCAMVKATHCQSRWTLLQNVMHPAIRVLLFQVGCRLW